MSLRYLKTAQIVPGKGMSYTLYEIEGENQIVRMLTAIPDAGEIKIYSKPVVKTLFAPERCEVVSVEEFSTFWSEGEAKK